MLFTKNNSNNKDLIYIQISYDFNKIKRLKNHNNNKNNKQISSFYSSKIINSFNEPLNFISEFYYQQKDLSPFFNYNLNNNNKNNNYIKIKNFKDLLNNLNNNKNTFNHLIIDIYSLKDIDYLLKLIFQIDNSINSSITIFGMCQIKETLEERMDHFLTVNRVWSYKYNLGCCKYNNINETTEYSQLLQIVKVDSRFPTFNFYKKLDTFQFNNLNSNINYKEYNCISGINKISKSNNKVLIHSLRPYGMISSFHFLGYSLTRSLEWGRTLIVDDTEFLFSNLITDLLLPVSNCKINNYNYNFSKESVQVLNHIEEKEYDDSKRISIITSDYRVYVNFIGCSKFPNQYFLNNDLFLFKSHIMNWLIRPNHKIRKLLEFYKNEFFGNSPLKKCLAIQIRNGDKIIELDKNTNTNNNIKNNPIKSLVYLNQYIDFIKNDSYCKQFEHIILITDNQTVIDNELPIIEKNNPNLHFHYLKNIIRNDETYKFGDYLLENNRDEDGLRKIKTKPNYKIGEGLLSEILLASECDFFLGSLTSNVARLIVELMNANRLTSPSLRIQLFKSLDNSNWFADP
ncbi:hypothetical protein DICPUDRAFT_80087 [Dictyostelium purpureum]|uniref:GT23 domain-containing protein n=1 Tax=Dictyostelium purpureum TaxID=5786 RepID=F0ZPH7_DICPU|nr:uncharacterized protein DICPUDRAFT_80087 [Dictyostelium purpureum]EGC34160.1 hypothetical protein DICPUDRAFT_80087 [Dictyostelium purpureum]|eukprot:XP_003289314.1 hypothetical protein DICPUDRAFT_80087 [Dictyostelium purpureum]